ncbi:sulfatase-like hydrolase/transferase [Paraglaciecola aquimarina]|uniref:Sulfatase-like hydrolase/transferase n=1 Tax=Paraglaciecola aquimarina TaxID=1235557 RepID=A0ABU3SVS1_9ALTE|nr:sulfatase-like hydrolase/transferase [Paraglaciecola aquimarina]MDU0354086.1 sulfatase-like hydrolase/transferase [Paraglaciecola aquimarina]
MKDNKCRVLAGLGMLIFAGAALAKTQQPNILWIITDDHRPDSIQAYNRATTGKSESALGYVSSPNIDKLASEGVLFTRAYNQSPACGPSRTSMHLGKYPFRTGKYAWEQVHQDTDFATPAVSQSLRDAGYSTAIIGKTHHAIRETFTGKSTIFDLEIEFNRDLYRQGFGGFYQTGAYGLIDGLLLRRDSKETVYYPDGRKKTYVLSKQDRLLTAAEQAVVDDVEQEFDILRAYTRINKGLILGGVNPQPADKTVDARIVDEYQNYLQNAGKTYKTLAGRKVQGADEDKPVFVNLGFHLPHTPVMPPKEFREQFADKKYKVPAFDSEELATFTPQQMQIYNESKTDAMKPEHKQQAIRDYYAFTAFGDSLIGEAVEDFKAYSKQQGRDYLIVFTVGDHGWHLGEQGIMAKFGSWKESLNGAVIVVSSDKKKFPAGKVVDKLVEYVDFAPTLMAAANIDVEDKLYNYLDGVDLDKIANDKTFRRDYILGEMNLVSGHRAYMRTNDFAFSMRTRDKRTVAETPYLNDNITWALNSHVLKADMALYDLRNDPLERNNIAYTLEYMPLANWFRNKLGNIVLGDGRVEMDWSTKNSYNISNFAAGSDDKIIDIPKELVPAKDITNLQRPNW